MDWRSLSQRRFPGRLQRSEAEWKAIRDPAQDSPRSGAEPTFAAASEGSVRIKSEAAPVIHIQRFRGSAANNALDSASPRAQIP